jgi:hypothetical protein
MTDEALKTEISSIQNRLAAAEKMLQVIRSSWPEVDHALRVFAMQEKANQVQDKGKAHKVVANYTE